MFYEWMYETFETDKSESKREGERKKEKRGRVCEENGKFKLHFKLQRKNSLAFVSFFFGRYNTFFSWLSLSLSLILYPIPPNRKKKEKLNVRYSRSNVNFVYWMSFFKSSRKINLMANRFYIELNKCILASKGIEWKLANVRDCRKLVQRVILISSVEIEFFECFLNSSVDQTLSNLKFFLILFLW